MSQQGEAVALRLLRNAVAYAVDRQFLDPSQPAVPGVQPGAMLGEL